MQEFATELVDKFRLSDVDPNKAHAFARIKAVFEQKKKILGSTQKQFLDALLTYCPTCGWWVLGGRTGFRLKFIAESMVDFQHCHCSLKKPLCVHPPKLNYCLLFVLHAPAVEQGR